MMDCLTQSYLKNSLDYVSQRFGLQNDTYTVKTSDFEFIFPILSKDGKVESGNLSYLPIPCVSGNISNKLIKKELSEYFEKIYALGKERIALRQDPLIQYHPQIIKSFLQEGFKPNLFYTSVLDLTLDYENLKQNLRKSYKSLIHGVENDNSFKFVIVDSEHNTDKINDWIDMYLSLVKRSGSNPSRETFKDYEISVMSDLAHLYLLYNSKEVLISGVYIKFNNKFAYYSASGTNIEHEKDNYFSHYLLWKAIVDLKQKGFQALEIGPIFYENVTNFYTPSEKELAISDFKLGMGGFVTPFVIWEKRG